MSNDWDKQQGAGPGTRWKEIGFRSELWISVVMSWGKDKKLARFPFWHLDLNCGTGRNDKVDCDGSPIEFLKIMDETGRLYCAAFCDKAKARCKKALKRRVRKMGHPRDGCSIRYWWHTNQTVIGAWAREIRKRENPNYAVGTILSDPNGPSRHSFPLAEIAQFAAKFPRIDVMLNINMDVMKRCRVAWLNQKKKRDSKVADFVKGMGLWPACTIQGIVDLIPRSHWTIRKPFRSGYNYTILVGRNKSSGQWKRLHFYPLDSSVGRSIVKKADA